MQEPGYDLSSPCLSRAETSAVYRILDANLDRAREGLRIIEEWCRFGLHHRELTEQLKGLRQALGQWHHAELRAARDTPGDPGTELTPPQETQREDVHHVLQANFCRVQEALRVLEEYGKLYNLELGQASKEMRYQVYSIESELLLQQRRHRLKQAYAYLVTSPHEHLISVVEAALQGGIDIVQYREKTAEDKIRLEVAKTLRRLCHAYGALFIVNDRVDLALAVDADGVHLGQQDLPIAVARELLGSYRLIGRSTTNGEEMRQALQEGADYVGVGPVFATPTKPDKAAAGLDYVRYAAAHCPIPWFAIGGINPQNLHEVLDAGAERVAVVRAIMEAEQPTLISQFHVAQVAHRQTLKSLQSNPVHAAP